MMRHELERFEQGFIYCLFDTPDRVQHMFWRDETEGQLLKPNRAAGVIAEH